MSKSSSPSCLCTQGLGAIAEALADSGRARALDPTYAKVPIANVLGTPHEAVFAMQSCFARGQQRVSSQPNAFGLCERESDSIRHLNLPGNGRRLLISARCRRCRGRRRCGWRRGAPRRRLRRWRRCRASPPSSSPRNGRSSAPASAGAPNIFDLSCVSSNAMP